MLGRQNVGVEGLKYVEFGVTRINRYIVECKCHWEGKTENEGGRINRYIVECKYLYSLPNGQRGHGINRYIVECKLHM